MEEDLRQALGRSPLSNRSLAGHLGGTSRQGNCQKWIKQDILPSRHQGKYEGQGTETFPGGE